MRRFSLLALALLLACNDPSVRPTVRVLAPATGDVAFGEAWVGATVRRPLALTNLGTGPLTIGSLSISGDPAFAAPAGGLRLAPGERVEVELSFAPLEVRAHAATLTVTSDAENAPTLQVALTGQGRAAPDCDDAKDCTEDGFDPAQGLCTHVPREGACDDGSACTTNGRCVDGECLGDAITCNDADPCTRDLCDAHSGCVALPDEEACGDGDPCTVDLCDKATGCAHAPAPDGTACGKLDGCTALHVCVAGQCRALAVPDGTPCSDGDLCTTGDSCKAGACVGTRSQSAAQVVNWVPSFGADNARAAWLDDQRFVVVDVGASGSQNVSVVRVAGGKLQLEASAQVPNLAQVDRIAAPAPDRFVVFQSSVFRVFDLVGAQVVQRGIGSLTGTTSWMATASHGGMLYVAHDDRLDLVDLSDPDVPLVRPRVQNTRMRGIAVDAARRELLLSTEDELRRYDVSQPPSPQPLPSPACVGCGLVATNGTLAAVRSGMDAAGMGGRVKLYRDLTLPAVGEIALAANQLVTALGFTPQGLVVTVLTNEPARMVTDLVLYDVAAPEQPRKAGLTPLFATGAYPGSFSTRGSHVLLDPRLLVFETVAASGQPFHMLTGPAHGSIDFVAASGGDVVALSDRAVHLLQGPVRSATAFTQGSVVVDPVGVARLGPGAQAPLLALTSHSEDPTIVSVPHDVLWPVLDVTNASSPTVVGSWTPGGILFFGVGRTDGRFLYSLTRGQGLPTSLALTVHDLAAAPSSFGTTLAPVGRWERAAVRADLANHAIAVDGERVVASLSLEADRSLVLLFDVSTRAAPQLLSSTEIPGHIGSLALSGNAIVAVHADQPFYWGFTGERLVVLSIDAGTHAMQESGRITLRNVGHVLGFDGHTAIVALPGAAQFLQVDRTPLVDLGLVPLPATPRGATFVDGALVIAAQSGIAVVDPPCPPAP